MPEHGRDHDERRFRYDHRTTRKHGAHAESDEERIPPSEPAPAEKLDEPEE